MVGSLSVNCLLSLLCLLVLASAENTELQKPYCSPENLDLADAAKGEWKLLQDGTFEIEFEHCRLRRFSRDKAAKCLKGSHLVFMGDSLSRYFYLSLATLFATGKWSRKFAKLPAHPSLTRSILSEKDFQNWSRFYYKSNKVLQNGKTAFELCDCYRNESRPWVPSKLGEIGQQRDCRESRHFRFIPESSNLDDQENDVRLSYIQWYGLMPMRFNPRISLYPRNSSFLNFVQGLNERICPKNNQSFYPLSPTCYEQRAEKGELGTNSVMDFSHQLFDCENDEYERNPNTKCQRFEKKVLVPLGTTHVILNIGWHSGLAQMDKKFLPKLIHAAENYFPLPGPDPSTVQEITNAPPSANSRVQSNIQSARVTWRTATYDALFQAQDSIAKELYQKISDKNKFNYFDVYAITKRLRIIDRLVVSKNYDELTKLITLSASWPKDLALNVSSVPSTWVDTAHPEPWAYEEIHTVYLNSVCPLTV
jgi:hypothetical protein